MTVTPLLSKKEKIKIYKASNKALIDNNQIRVKAQGHDFTIKYYDTRAVARKEKERSRLPVHEFMYEDIMWFADHKYYGWQYATMSQYTGRNLDNGRQKTRMVLVQDKPFIVLDIDGKWSEADIKRMLKVWRFSMKHNVSYAKTKNGWHIHILLDLSSLPKKNECCTSEEAETYYKTTTKYKILETLKVWMADTIEKDSGIKVDRNALATDEIAITPSEIGEINLYWGKHSPVKITEKIFEKALKTFKSTKIVRPKKYERQISKFLEVFERDLKKMTVSDVKDFLVKIGVTPGKDKYYHECIKTLNRNIKEIIAYYCANLDNLWCLRKKSSGIGISRVQAASFFFGLSTARNMTYFRHIGMFIFDLMVEKEYVERKKVNEYKRANISKELFSSDILDETWYVPSRAKVSRILHVPSSQQVAAKLGGGKTWDVLSHVLPFLVANIGADKTINLLAEAIDSSSANEKPRRIRDMERYARKIERKLLEKQRLSNVQI